MKYLRNLLKVLTNKYIALKYLISLEKESKSELNLFKKINCLIHGFSSSKYGLYNLKENSQKIYLSDYQRRKTAKINGDYSLVINDKHLFDKVFSSESMTASIYGRLKNGKIFIGKEEQSFNILINLLKQEKELIIKRYKGGGGKDIYRLSVVNDSFYLDDYPKKQKELEQIVRSFNNHLIMEHLTQAKYSSDIYPGTINSIRIITMRDPETDEIFIPIAVHKFGSEKTKPVDNVWKGGLTALIDFKTGRLGAPAYHHENNNKIEWRSVHPDTQREIEGTIIPHWQEVKSKVKEIAQVEDNLKYVGWDIVVTENGIKLIEGNNYSDVNILQIHQPLLTDEKTRKFYKYHGII